MLIAIECTRPIIFGRVWKRGAHTLQKWRLAIAGVCKLLWRWTVPLGNVFTSSCGISCFCYWLHSHPRESLPRLVGVGRAVLADPVEFTPVRWFQGGFRASSAEQEGVGGGIGGLAKSPAVVWSRAIHILTLSQHWVAWAPSVTIGRTVQHRLSPGRLLGTLSTPQCP